MGVYGEDSDTPSSPRFASHPFDDEDADVIVLSSDNVYFKMYRVLLGKMSPVFKDMFGLPQSPPAQSDPDDFFDGLPLVKITENSHTLGLLFAFCYPMDDPMLQNIDDARAVLEAAHKYEMDAIAKRARASWTAVAGMDALKAFAIACSMGWEDEARIAARLTLDNPIWPLEPPLPVEFAYVSAENLLRLQSYHRKCVAAACKFADDTGWGMQVLNSLVCAHCDKLYSGSTQASLLANWLHVFQTSAKAILMSQPSSAVVANQTVVFDTIRRAYGSPPCDLPMHAFEKIKSVARMFGEELDSRVSSVSVKLTFLREYDSIKWTSFRFPLCFRCKMVDWFA